MSVKIFFNISWEATIDDAAVTEQQHHSAFQNIGKYTNNSSQFDVVQLFQDV